MDVKSDGGRLGEIVLEGAEESAGAGGRLNPCGVVGDGVGVYELSDTVGRDVVAGVELVREVDSGDAGVLGGWCGRG